MTSLAKKIGIISGTSIAISMVIGSGLLGLPGVVIDEVGPTVALYSWIAIVAFMLPMLVVFMKLGMRFPKVGGLSYYAEIALGPWAKASVVTILVGTFFLGIPALAFIGAAYAGKFIGDTQGQYTGLIAVGFLLTSVGINLAGVKLTSFVNSISIIFVIAVVGLILFGNLNMASKGVDVLLSSNYDSLSWHHLWAAFSLIFWAFLGWENLSFGLEEFERPNKTIPSVYFLSFFIVLMLYWTLALTASGASVTGQNISGPAGLSVLFPNSMQAIINGLIAVIILANANSWVFGCSRLVFSAGQNGILPSFLGKLNPSQIPSNSLLLMGTVFTIIIGFMTAYSIPVNMIVKLVSQNFIVLFGISVIAFYKSEQKSFTTALVTILAALSCLFLISGFNAWMLYPVLLVVIGYTRHVQMTRLLKTA